MNILNVDTDPASAAALHLLLGVAGHTVTTVESLYDVGECAEFNLAFISPDYLDRPALSALRDLRTKTRVPVIALLEGPIDPSHRRAMVVDVGADACLSRPFDRWSILSEVARLVELNGRCATVSPKPAPKGPGSRATGEAPSMGGRTHIARMCQSN